MIFLRRYGDVKGIFKARAAPGLTERPSVSGRSSRGRRPAVPRDRLGLQLVQIASQGPLGVVQASNIPSISSRLLQNSIEISQATFVMDRNALRRSLQAVEGRCRFVLP